MDQAEIYSQLDSALRLIEENSTVENVNEAMGMLFRLRAELKAEQRAGG